MTLSGTVSVKNVTVAASTDTVANANTARSRWNGLDSVDIGGTVYQAMCFWDDSEYLVIGVRTYGGSWTHYTYDGSGGLATIQRTGSDSHDAAVLGLDANGYIHVSYDHHVNALNYRVSTNPITTFAGTLSALSSMLGTNEAAVTYPTFFRDPATHVLYFMFRDGGSGNGNLYFYSYDAALTTWSAAAGTGTAGILIDGVGSLPDQSPYWFGPPVFSLDWDGAGTGFMYLSWIWRADTNASSASNVCAVRWDSTAFTKMAGAAQAVPIDYANADVVDPTPANNGLTGNESAAVDSLGSLHLSYEKNDGSGNGQIYHARYSSGAWTIGQVTTGIANLFKRTDMVIDPGDDTAHIVHRNSAVGEGMYVAVATSPYTSWTIETLIAETTHAEQSPWHDPYQWRANRRYETLFTGELTDTVEAANGTLSVTLDDASLSATGEVPVQGSLSQTLDDATLSSTGTVLIQGTLSVTLDDATLSAEGNATGGVNGTLSVTLDDATLSSTGEVLISGSLSKTLDDATLSAAGTVTSSGGVNGSLSVTLDDATLVSAGTVTGAVETRYLLLRIGADSVLGVRF